MNSVIEINETNFVSEVLESSVPVVVDFWAPWCGPCKALGPVIEEVAAETAGRIKVAKVNLGENQELAQRFRVEAIPTLLYFSGGQLRDRALGFTSKKAILAKLEKLAQPVQTT
jgi:thioredoxin 1